MAASAAPGDRLVFSGPGGGYAPDDTADWHLFVGDESAVPAVSAALDALPADAVGVALLEVHGPDHEIAVDTPDGVEIRWLHRDGAEAGTTSLLADALAELPWRGGRVQVFAHGEREAMKAVRDELRRGQSRRTRVRERFETRDRRGIRQDPARPARNYWLDDP